MRGKYMKNLKKIPQFDNEDKEREFWSNNDATEYINFAKSKKMYLPNIKPTTRSISIRLPESLIYKLKNIANKKDIPYQSLIKLFLAEKVNEEMKKQ